MTISGKIPNPNNHSVSKTCVFCGETIVASHPKEDVAEKVAIRAIVKHIADNHKEKMN